MRIEDHRYVVCLNSRQARKDAADREAIVQSLREQLARGARTLIGNQRYRKDVRIEKESVSIDLEKIETQARFDGKWVLRTNTDLSAGQVALKYKQLWRVEHAFRDMKSRFETRPIFHQRDETIRGHVFCSFLALLLRKELDRRLEKAGHHFEWADIKQDLRALQVTVMEERGKSHGSFSWPPARCPSQPVPSGSRCRGARCRYNRQSLLTIPNHPGGPIVRLPRRRGTASCRQLCPGLRSRDQVSL